MGQLVAISYVCCGSYQGSDIGGIIRGFVCISMNGCFVKRQLFSTEE